MKIKLGVLMDPIQNINIKKDTTFAILLEAQHQGFELFYMEEQDLFVQNEIPLANMRTLSLQDDPTNWFAFTNTISEPLKTLDIILMRKDPPIDRKYLYTTQILELAEKEGVKVINKPQALRDFNEKIFTSWFPSLTPETLITSNSNLLKEFIQIQKDVILKPLHGMGGYAVFRVQENESNINVIIETLTNKGDQFIMAQQFIPEIVNGDKRILIIDGKPFPYALARKPKKGDIRANLAAGGHGSAVEINSRDREISKQVGPLLKEKGIIFAGLDVIGDYLTEINITSPTCVREIEAQCKTNICADILKAIQEGV